MNKAILEGRAGRDPEVRYSPDGLMICTISLATSNDYKKKGTEEWVKKPASWHNLVAFGSVAEQLANTVKGQKLKVEGKITYRQWEKDGIKRTNTEIHVFSVEGEEYQPTGTGTYLDNMQGGVNDVGDFDDPVPF